MHVVKLVSMVVVAQLLQQHHLMLELVMLVNHCACDRHTSWSDLTNSLEVSAEITTALQQGQRQRFSTVWTSVGDPFTE